MHPARISILTMLLAACVSPAMAQSYRPSDALWKPGAPQKLDPTFEDMGPLRTSTKVLRPDLRVPFDFEHVYRVPGSSRGVRTFGPANPGGGLGAERYQRISGGLSAVFSASEYEGTRKGKIIALTPAGTVFYIGGIPREEIHPARTAASEYVSTQVYTGIVTQAPRAARELPIGSIAAIGQADQGAPQTLHTQIVQPISRSTQPRIGVLTSEAFRRQRVRELLLSSAEK